MTQDIPQPIMFSADRPLPHDMDKEKAILAVMLEDNDCIDVATERLTPEAFYAPANRLIFDAILKCRGVGKPVDLSLAADVLRQDGNLEKCGGLAYLFAISAEATTGQVIPAYAEVLNDMAIRRHIIRHGAEIATRAYDRTDETSGILADFGKAAYEASGLKFQDTFSHIRPHVDTAAEKIDKITRGDMDALGLPTGWPELDELFMFRKAEYVVIGARPSIGKSALMLNMTQNLALYTRIPVGIFSIEMAPESLTERLIHTVSEVPFWKFRYKKATTADWEAYNEAGARLRAAPIYIDNASEMTIMEIRAKSRRMVSEYGVRVIFIDYVQIVKETGNQRWGREREVSFVSQNCKHMARELGVTVVALAQVRRDADTEPPKLSHLRESGSLEQDADVVAFIHRERYPKEEGTKRCEGQLLIPKQRNAETGEVDLVFEPSITKFTIGKTIDDADVPEF